MTVSKLSSQPYKGTRDFYPEDKVIQDYIFDKWRQVVQSFGYQEYGTPLLEPLEVYTAKSGQELATEQTYSFTDRGGRVVAIRPEMTPSVSRLVAARRQELAYPARLFSIANFMRYERTQRGREREFWQLNVDIFGADGVAAEAEIISLADKLIRTFGATKDMYVIKINNRKLINFVMAQYLGLNAAAAQSMIRLLDRKNKLPDETFFKQADDIFGEEQAASGRQRLNELFSAKTMADLPSEVLSSNAIKEIRDLFTLLNRLGIDSVAFDITLMRGFDYYTGTVFEVFDTDPENNRAMFGGGRYDGLVGLFGAEPISAVGFAPGYTTTELFLRSHNLLPELKPTIDAYVISIGDTAAQTLKIAEQLRASGVVAEVDVTDRKLDKQIKAADKKGATWVVFVGEAEIDSGLYTAKNLDTGQERKIGVDDFAQLMNNK